MIFPNCPRLPLRREPFLQPLVCLLGSEGGSSCSKKIVSSMGRPLPVALLSIGSLAAGSRADWKPGVLSAGNSLAEGE